MKVMANIDTSAFNMRRQLAALHAHRLKVDISIAELTTALKMLEEHTARRVAARQVAREKALKAHKALMIDPAKRVEYVQQSIKLGTLVYPGWCSTAEAQAGYRKQLLHEAKLAASASRRAAAKKTLTQG